MSDSDKQPSTHDQIRIREAINQLESLPDNLREALLKKIDANFIEVKNEVSKEASSTSSGGRPQGSKGVSNVKRAFHSLRMKPGEVIDKVSQRVEELTVGGVEQVRSEVRRLVEQVDLHSELIKILSQLSIELKTTIKLEPKEDNQLGIKPKVTTEAKLKWGNESGGETPFSTSSTDEDL